MKRPEILSPAGDLERLKFAVLYGADAVYVGATEFGMRSAPKNFTMEQLAEGVRFAHARGRRVYLTLNTVPTNEEIARMPEPMRSIFVASRFDGKTYQEIADTTGISVRVARQPPAAYQPSLSSSPEPPGSPVVPQMYSARTTRGPRS